MDLFGLNGVSFQFVNFMCGLFKLLPRIENSAYRDPNINRFILKTNIDNFEGRMLTKNEILGLTELFLFISLDFQKCQK